MKINTPLDLGALLRDARKAKKWNQEELAMRVGVYQRDISNYENKPEKISVDMLLKLTAALSLELRVDKPSSITDKPGLGF